MAMGGQFAHALGRQADTVFVILDFADGLRASEFSRRVESRAKITPECVESFTRMYLPNHSH
jgi:hypothetical protein